VDTRLLAAYFVNEAHSARAEEVMRDTRRYPLAISEWTKTGFISALGIKCRTGQLHLKTAVGLGVGANSFARSTACVRMNPHRQDPRKLLKA
jgi:hypothetical protein